MDCQKNGYGKKEAETRLNELRRQKRLNKRPQRIYYCEDCNMWHITARGDFEKGKLERS